MKRITTIFTALFCATGAFAQFNVWKDGKIIFTMKDGYPDSITVANPTETNDNVAIGRFSVNENLQIAFAPGNLQCYDKYGEWYFAEKQYEVVGMDNENISIDYDEKIDLFGWATSGWDAGFEVSSISTNYKDYLLGGEWNNNMTGNYSSADWGFNDIINGGDGVWRTPTSNEWDYLFTKRKNADKLFALATVANVKGLVILPDDWKMPEGLTFLPSTESRLVYQNGYYEDSDLIEDNYSDNVYSEDDWSTMESAGAVFLPAAGRRWGSEIKNYPSFPWGIYWSSTVGDEERNGNVKALSFYMSGVTPMAETSRVYGCSVRLIQELK